MSQLDPKVLELQQQVKLLQEQVGRLLTQVQYLDRERIRAKNEIGQVMNEVRSRRN
jgi:peptidoglycan hydrolase CwlO-like protein